VLKYNVIIYIFRNLIWLPSRYCETGGYTELADSCPKKYRVCLEFILVKVYFKILHVHELLLNFGRTDG